VLEVDGRRIARVKVSRLPSEQSVDTAQTVEEADRVATVIGEPVDGEAVPDETTPAAPDAVTAPDESTPSAPGQAPVASGAHPYSPGS